MKIKSLVRTLIIFACVCLMGACDGKGEAQEKETQKEAVDSGVVRIAVTPTLDCMPLVVAEAYDMFESEGLNVKLVPFTAQMDQDTALVGGSVMGMTTDLVRARRLEREGLSLTYATATIAHWLLLTGRMARIKQLRQLDDKMLAMTRYSATQLLSDKAVEMGGLKPERVFRIQVNDVAVRLRMLQGEMMDAELLPEPQAAVARADGAHVLLNSDSLNMQLGVVVFLREAVDTTALNAFRRAYDRACDTLNNCGLMTFAPLIEQHCNVAANNLDSLPANYQFRKVSEPRKADLELVDTWWQKQLNNHVDKR